MNKVFFAILLSMSLPLSSVYAAPEEPAGDGGPHGGPHAGMIGERVERLGRELNLTDEQKAQVKTIIQEEHAKHKAIFDETRARLDGVLNAEQKTKFDEMMKNRIKHGPWGGHHPRD